MKVKRKNVILLGILAVLSLSVGSCRKKEVAAEKPIETKSKFSASLIDTLRTFYAQGSFVKKEEVIYLVEEHRFKGPGLSISADSLLMYYRSNNQKK